MNNLVKIKDVSEKYEITARTLRYYEDMGLIESCRSDEYAYRLYDENAVRRIEQIIILRKLNISIKDIQHIFNTSGSDAVLDALGKKVDDIDSEVSLLHELKDIILDFIAEIKQVDFGKDADIKLLYDKANEIETRLVNVDYDGNSQAPITSAKVDRLIEITEKLDKKIPDVMIVRIPAVKAITSGRGGYDVVFGPMGWEDNPRNRHLVKNTIVLQSSHFLIRHEIEHGHEFEFIVGVNDEITSEEASPYEVIDFSGGLYAMAVSIDSDGESIGKVEAKIRNWVETTNFELDTSRGVMGNMNYIDDEINKGLGYAQLMRFVPIKLRSE